MSRHPYAAAAAAAAVPPRQPYHAAGVHRHRPASADGRMPAFGDYQHTAMHTGVVAVADVAHAAPAPAPAPAVPFYSAAHHDRIASRDLAHRGREREREPRPVDHAYANDNNARANANADVNAPAANATTTIDNQTRHTAYKHDISFNVGSRYRVCDVIGEGAYGVVCSAIHRPTGLKVAIKKITPFEHQMFALRTLRELKLLRYWQDSEVSENIISILDLVRPTSLESFHEVYLIQELMETDLHRVIRSQKLSDDHAQYFTYQVLRALKAIHSADVIHRDLKPGNLLLNANCDLKVCDFGLARSLRTAEPAEGSETGLMTEYVATRWYRAPEIMLTFKQYTKSIDVWAVGCILGEMISGKPMFPGRDYHDQLNRILNTLGTPSLYDFYAISSRRSREYIRSLPFRKRRPFQELFPNASAEAIDFLEKTLTFSPKKRATVDELLAHPYLAAYHDETDEPTCDPMPAEMWACDDKDDMSRNSKERLKVQLFEEIRSFRPLI